MDTLARVISIHCKKSVPTEESHVSRQFLVQVCKFVEAELEQSFPGQAWQLEELENCPNATGTKFVQTDGETDYTETIPNINQRLVVNGFQCVQNEE